MHFIEHTRIFMRVAELASFTQAADDLGLPKASVSTAVQQLENSLGVRLLHRTTRKVTLTQDGQAYYERSKDALDDLDELENMFQQQSNSVLKGRVRIDMPTVVAQETVLPRLHELLDLHPQLEIELSSTERRVDLIREGFDCVVRAGNMVDPGLVARRLGTMRMLNCISPLYRQRYGTPETLEQLAQHRLVHYVPILGGKSAGFDYVQDERDCSLAMAGNVTVNNALAYQSACLAGLGIIQVPAPGVRALLASGQLIAILPQYEARPMPLSLVYANRRNLSGRVRVVMDWLAEVLEGYLAGADAAAS